MPPRASALGPLRPAPPPPPPVCVHAGDASTAPIVNTNAIVIRRCMRSLFGATVIRH
jgi:hypothetical protein